MNVQISHQIYGRGERTLSQKLSTFLFQYRNIPNVTTGMTRSELFLGRRVHTRLSLLAPDIAELSKHKALTLV